MFDVVVSVTVRVRVSVCEPGSAAGCDERQAVCVACCQCQCVRVMCVMVCPTLKQAQKATWQRQTGTAKKEATKAQARQGAGWPRTQVANEQRKASCVAVAVLVLVVQQEAKTESAFVFVRAARRVHVCVLVP